MTEVFLLTLGMHRWLSWRHELDLAADTGYFLLTTLAGRLTTLYSHYLTVVLVIMKYCFKV